MAKQKTWKEKLHDSKGLPCVKEIEGKLSKRWGTGTFVIPAPIEVDELMRLIPRGRLVTINELRQALAEKHGTSMACPLTTGIFAWIAAHAAAEDPNLSPEKRTPYWRTLKSGGELNPKFPGGIESLKKLLESEGHTVVQKGRKFLVQDYENALARPDPESNPAKEFRPRKA